MEALDAMLVSAGLANAAIPRQALFLAGKAFQVIGLQVAERPECSPISSLAPTRWSPTPL
jgi:hypothetical protein